jgi:hypothetical protein
MGVGVFLLILGAILAFAVRKDTSAIDLQIVGVILMVAGGAILYFVRNGKTVRETITRDDLSDPSRPVHIVREEFNDENS